MPDFMLDSMPERFVRKTLALDRFRFSYREWQGSENLPEDVPDALPVVLLHGISSGAASWSDCAAALAHETAGSLPGRPLRILAWDAPGYGDSSPLPQAAPDAGDYADALRCWLDALHVPTCVLVGHSLGALMAAAFVQPHTVQPPPAQQHPTQVQALLLVSPAIGYGDTPKAHEVLQSRLAGVQAGIEQMAENLPDRLLSVRASHAQREQVRRVARQLHAAGYTQAVHMLCHANLARYTRLPALTRVCCGEDDLVTPPEQSRAYAARQGLPYTALAHAGHACPVEQPAALAGIIKELIHESQTRSQVYA